MTFSGNRQGPCERVEVLNNIFFFGMFGQSVLVFHLVFEFVPTTCRSSSSARAWLHGEMSVTCMNVPSLFGWYCRFGCRMATLRRVLYSLISLALFTHPFAHASAQLSSPEDSGSEGVNDYKLKLSQLRDASASTIQKVSIGCMWLRCGSFSRQRTRRSSDTVQSRDLSLAGCR